MNKGEFQFRGDVFALPEFRMRLWGDFTVTDSGGNLITPRGRKARALLAWLALHSGRPISRERLCGLLWGDRGEEQARASLRQALFELKPFSIGPHPLLQIDRAHVILDPAAVETDIDQIWDAATGADPAPLNALLPDHDERFLSNLDDIDSGFDEWLFIERTRQRDRLESLTARSQPLAAPHPPARPQSPPQSPPQPPPQSAPQSATSVPAFPAPPPANPGRAAMSWQVWLGLVLSALALIGGLLAWRTLRPAPSPPLAIAVLPFEDLSGSGTPYFAEGVSEEIRNRLARNPGLKVLGRTSAASLAGENLGPSEIGQKLAVDYLVEGSVRTAGPAVRVSVALVRTGDGARLWSQQYSGTVADTFSIQDRIGSSVARRLNLAEGVRPETALKAEGEAYSLYLRASSMLRRKEPDAVEPAIALLRQALQQEPGFAQAWAELGMGYALRSQYSQREPDRAAGRRAATAAANKALQLQPGLAMAHLVLGTVLEDRPARREQLLKAARLDPNSAEIWAQLSDIYTDNGDYPGALDAWRRAVAIDPLWWVAFYNAAELAWDMGYRDETAAYVRRVEAGSASVDPCQVHMVRGDMAWRRGDYSEQFAQAQKAWLVADSGKRFFAELAMARALRAVGRYDEAGRNWAHYPFDATMLAMWKGVAPPPERIATLLQDSKATWISRSRMHFLLSSLLTAGRTTEVTRLYDARYASAAEMEADYGPNSNFIWQAVLVARALRENGRTADADSLLARATAAAAAIEARGRVPTWHLESVAVLRAATGQPQDAVRALHTAADRGWFYSSTASFADIADDPAYRPIRTHPGFQRIRNQQAANTAREAHEIAALPIDPRIKARFGIT